MSDSNFSTLKICSDPKYLKDVREAVAGVAQEAGFDEEWRGRIILAVDEAITNVIRHIYGGVSDAAIHIKIKNDIDALRISIQDFGEKPDLEKIKSRALEDVRPGGLGCHFISEIMDEVVYDIESHEVGTELKLTKYKSK